MEAKTSYFVLKKKAVPEVLLKVVEAKRLLAENRDCLDRIAEFLIEKETITGKEFMEIFRKVKEEADGYQQEELIFAE